MGNFQRRHSIGFGYIGFGNNQSVFNRKSKLPFSEIKEKLLRETLLHYKIDFLHKKLSYTDRQFIKNKIKQQEQKVFVKTSILSAFLIIFLGIVTYFFISKIMSR